MPERAGDETSRAAHSGASANEGFSARLSGSSLFDLIQFECQDRARKIVRVSDGVKTAFLYFRDGNIVHAIEGREVGETAVRNLLRWQRGTLEHVDGLWPTHESIALPWQGLLLRATQAEDEAKRPPKVLTFPTRDVAGERGGEDVTRRTPMPGAGDPATMTLRLSPRGEVTAGNASEELSEVVAYAVQMADLIGELLGVDRFQSMELALANGACLIAREPGGDVVAVRAGRAIDPSTLRQTLGMP